MIESFPTPTPSSRPANHKIINLADDSLFDADGSDLLAGLTQTPPFLPGKYAYDRTGSVLYEEITRSSEYHIWRVENYLLERSVETILDRIGPCDIVELGSGDASKTEHLLRTIRPSIYTAIDVSESALEESLQRIEHNFSGVDLHGIVGTYERGLERLQADRSVGIEGSRSRLYVFLGSSLGNLEPGAASVLLDKVAAAAVSGDHVLIGIDLIKDPSAFEHAYNGEASQTFNLNKLSHINKLFDGDFDEGNFLHRALYNQRADRVEAKLHSLVTHTVTLGRLNRTITLPIGTVLISDIMRKFSISTVVADIEERGFERISEFCDEAHQFALCLFRRR